MALIRLLHARAGGLCPVWRRSVDGCPNSRLRFLNRAPTSWTAMHISKQNALTVMLFPNKMVLTLRSQLSRILLELKRATSFVTDRRATKCSGFPHRHPVNKARKDGYSRRRLLFSRQRWPVKGGKYVTGKHMSRAWCVCLCVGSILPDLGWDHRVRQWIDRRSDIPEQHQQTGRDRRGLGGFKSQNPRICA